MRKSEAWRWIKELDKQAESANNLWHCLEHVKRKVADDAGITAKQLHDEGIYVREIDGS